MAEPTSNRQPTLAERIVLLEIERERSLFEQDLMQVEAIGNRQLDALKSAAGLFEISQT